MSDPKYEALKLENQLCFPLYACAREVVKRYKPFLDELDLTYTQYIAMLVLWERRSVTAKELGSCLYLDSGTLTPLLKKLEAKGLLTRRRSEQDERSLVLSITQQGMDLRAQAEHIPQAMGKCVELEGAEKETLLRLLRKMMDGIER